jgi:hypothetical protein
LSNFAEAVLSGRRIYRYAPGFSPPVKFDMWPSLDFPAVFNLIYLDIRRSEPQTQSDLVLFRKPETKISGLHFLSNKLGLDPMSSNTPESGVRRPESTREG